MSYIEIYDRAGSRRIPVGGYYTLGRALSNDVILYGAEVSRNHAKFAMQGDRVILEDVGSTHGTSINGRPLFGPHMLRDGDQVRMGDVRLIYRYLSRASTNRPPTPAHGLPVNLSKPSRPAQPRLAANLVRCVYCGAINLKNNTLCYNCGHALLDSLDTPLRPPTMEKTAIERRPGARSLARRRQVVNTPPWLVALLTITIVVVLCLVGLLAGMLLAEPKLRQAWTAFGMLIS
jgi:pSer/pThr/pTyr-binding forkhead associated (FHA) protein